MVRDPRDGPAAPVHHRPYRRLGLGIALAAVVVAVSWTLVVDPDVTPAEERLFRAVNTAPDVLWPLVWPPMQLGTIAAPAVVATAAAAALRRWRAPTATLIAGYLSWAAAQAVKALAARDRPDALLSGVVLREGAQGLGFVSGHAAIATALATTLWPYLSTRGRILSLVLVAAVGFGRIYAGAHLPLDVVGGIAIGALVGIAVNALVGVPSDRLVHPHGRPTADSDV
ncbi:MAG TPA: phosphatase PAP2 family protein [Euzebyales bacterium]|nr:phosphatase PAP2 family protein [Euzebyales bacterium]